MQAVLKLADMEASQRKILSKNAQQYYQEQLCLEKGVAAFVQHFINVMRV